MSSNLHTFTYLMTSFFAWALLFLIWRTSTWVNIAIKVGLLAMWLWTLLFLVGRL